MCADNPILLGFVWLEQVDVGGGAAGLGFTQRSPLATWARFKPADRGGRCGVVKERDYG